MRLPQCPATTCQAFAGRVCLCCTHWHVPVVNNECRRLGAQLQTAQTQHSYATSS